MKKLLALLLALAVSFSLAIPAFAANTALDGIEYDGFTVLSNCSDDELLAFLRENDIAIPDGLADSQEHLLELVRYFIAEIETSLDKGTQRKTTENELPSLTQCTA